MAKCIASSTLATPSDTYLYSLAQSSRGNFATIGSDDSLRLFDPHLHPLHLANHCHAGVSCLTSDGTAHYLTGGRDGLLHIWDTRARISSTITEPRHSGFSSVACREHYIAAGTESTKEGLGDVSVLLFDSRNPATPLRTYTDSHTDTITQLAFHPTHSHVLLSGSTDGLVSVFDVNHADEDDALHQVLNPCSAVHCAGFLAEDAVYVVSTDEQFSIYTLPSTGSEDERIPPPPQHFGDVRPTLQCAYVVDVLPQLDGPPLMAYGHHENQTLSIVSLGSPGAWGFGPKVELPGAHGLEVVRDVLVVGQQAYSCGEDGQVKVWDLASGLV